MRCSCSRAAIFALAGMLAASAVAATRAYFVEPKEYHAGWTPEDEYVAQSFVANVDSIYYLGEKRGKRGTLPYFIDSLRPSAMLGTCQG